MKKSTIQSLVEKSCKRIAPAWPLKNFVAVNPFVGFSDTAFSDTAKHMSKRGNVRMTMPIQFYLDQIENKAILPADIASAFQKQDRELNSLALFIEKAQHAAQAKDQSQTNNLTLTHIASEITSKDWNGFIVDRISSWATSYFDDYIAIWNTSDVQIGIYQSWKTEAEIDRSTELMGLPNFRQTIKHLPADPMEMITFVLEQIKLPEETAEAYLHANLLKMIGWSSYISGLDFSDSVYSKPNRRLEEFLAIILAYEFYFYNTFGNEKIKETWYKNLYSEETIDALSNEKIELEIILQDAFDFACQRSLVDAFSAHTPMPSNEKKEAQMVFCIDVRSEVFRRNLESVTSKIETIGFAGFFGFSINYVPLGHSEGKNHCPVLIPTGATVKETFSDQRSAARRRKTVHQIEKTWKKFKSGAVTSFGFVSPLGLTFLPRLILNSTGVTRPVADPKTDRLTKWFSDERILDLSSISLEQKVAMAVGALTGMGIKDNLAPLVLITGHGSTSVNNPHASGLDCGACGGHSGEINAMTAAQILNEKVVRTELVKQGIVIPENTLFLACLHDTTTDEIEIINEKFIPESHVDSVASIKKALTKASEFNRIERSKRMNIENTIAENISKKVIGRSNDWAQVRPEWGLAGCNAFVVAPRTRTLGLDLKGKSFLQSYDATNDPGYGILESIMTAPMVVTSWINLQYYASSVDNLHFGSGNKTLHNVVGGIGVIEGSSGDLRIGLPLQSVHTGEKLEHTPQRLNVVIEAPLEAINGILTKHETIKQLCDNSWITLLRLDENGKISHRYTRDCNWDKLDKTTQSDTQRKLQTV